MEFKFFNSGQGFKTQGPLGSPGGNAQGLFTNVISTSIGVISAIAFIYAIFVFLIGAFGIITAGGDAKKVAEARKKIQNGIIGIVVVISAIFILDFIGVIFGIDILNPLGFVFP